MFDKETFSNVLKKISSTYGTMTEFAQKADFDRTYISKYINIKLENPPSPKILEKIANASKDITSYADLMIICGYYDNNDSLIKETTRDVLNDYSNEIIKYNFSQNQMNEFKKIIFSFLDVNPEKLKVQMHNFSQQFSSNKDSIYNLIFNIFESITSLYNEYVMLLGKSIGYSESKIKSDIKKAKQLIVSQKEENQYYMCPVYCQINTEQPNFMEENIEGRLPIHSNLMNISDPEECFFLRVNGESMNNLVKDGGYALIRKQDMVENGEIAVVLVNGYNATLKKFSKQGDLVILEPMSTNPNFTTQVYGKDTPIRILGKYIGKFEMN